MAAADDALAIAMRLRVELAEIQEALELHLLVATAAGDAERGGYLEDAAAS